MAGNEEEEMTRIRGLARKRRSTMKKSRVTRKRSFLDFPAWTPSETGVKDSSRASSAKNLYLMRD